MIGRTIAGVVLSLCSLAARAAPVAITVVAVSYTHL